MSTRFGVANSQGVTVGNIFEKLRPIVDACFAFKVHGFEVTSGTLSLDCSRVQLLELELV